jgi:hypothetical protein
MVVLAGFGKMGSACCLLNSPIDQKEGVQVFHTAVNRGLSLLILNLAAYLLLGACSAQLFEETTMRFLPFKKSIAYI